MVGYDSTTKGKAMLNNARTASAGKESLTAKAQGLLVVIMSRGTKAVKEIVRYT